MTRESYFLQPGNAFALIGSLCYIARKSFNCWKGIFMGSFGLTLANRGVIIGAVTVPELFDMTKRGEDSGAFSAVWVGDSLLAKPRLESIALLSALAAITKRVKLAVGCMATFPHRHPALLAQQWASLDVISGGRSWLAVCLGGPNEQSPAQALEHKVMRSITGFNPDASNSGATTSLINANTCGSASSNGVCGLACCTNLAVSRLTSS